MEYFVFKIEPYGFGVQTTLAGGVDFEQLYLQSLKLIQTLKRVFDEVSRLIPFHLTKSGFLIGLKSHD